VRRDDDAAVDEVEYIASLVARSGITDAHAITAVTAVTGDPPRSVEQFAGGHAAVPFWATAADGRELVVRVSMAGDAPYAREQTVMARVRAAGIPVPDVVGVTAVDGHPVSVLERVNGTPLLHVMYERGANDPLVRRLCADAGEVLRAIHAVDTSGLDLIPNRLFHHSLNAFMRTYPRPRDSGLMFRAAQKCMTRHTPVTPTLLHRDFGPDHVLVDEHGIVGIIDWERAALGDPAYDVAWWSTHFTLPDVTLGTGAATRAGYGAGLDTDFDARIAHWHIAQSVDAAVYNFESGMTAEIERYVDNVRVAMSRGGTGIDPLGR
jgi:aminoglycoside phosphotransferase (APT) family kinase protein